MIAGSERRAYDALGRTERGRTIQARVKSSIRTKLTVSYVLVVMVSGFIYAAGGFFVLMFALGFSGYTQADIVRNLPTLFALAVFVLFNILLVTLCGVVAASYASWRFAKRLTRQVDELARATDEFAMGHLESRARVLSEDELGMLAQRFNFLAERLEDADAQRRAFVANISHDLRTPVAIIRGHLDAQLREGDDAEGRVETREAFQIIGNEAETLGKLIDDLFTLSRLEEAVLEIGSSPVNLAEIIEGSVRGIRPNALRQSRVSVNAMVEPDLQVMGDAMRITQIIGNLVHNAVRHTPEGGVVIVSANPIGSDVQVTVQDTGVGIEEDRLPYIFDRFYHGHSTRDSGGTGLGLSIVKQLVEAQGGQVGAESIPGEGTSIWFRLPAIGGDAAVTTTPRPKERGTPVFRRFSAS